ncbi:MAG: hypothetical protein R3C51_02160 [Parvularculaceae bacterium]
MVSIAKNILAGAAALLAFAPAAAQEPQGDELILNCRETSPDADARIACLEAAITSLASPAGLAAQRAPNVAQVGVGANEAVQNEVSGLGAEQVIARTAVKGDDGANDIDEKVNAAVTEFAQTPSGAYVFFLDNGQVWRQKRADSNRIRLSAKRQYTVSVSPGAISGYRLKVNELRRTLLVERVK